MKTYNNLFSKLCSLENLQLAFKKARKGKSKKWYVNEFESDLDNELAKLKLELEVQNYKPKPLKRFIIRDPKTRVIHASAFRDRVVHHALCNMIEPIFEKTFISDSYANRKGKGTHAAVERFDTFVRSVSGNGKLLQNAINNNQVYGYALKVDIKHYFDSVDHEILVRILDNKIKDEKMIWLIRRILENHNCKSPGKGMS
jgi:retron-type reverse transcriptase